MPVPSPWSVKVMKAGSGKPGISLVALSVRALPSASTVLTVNCCVVPRARLKFCTGSTTGVRLRLSTVIGTVTVVVAGVPVPSPSSTAVSVTW